MEWPQIQQPFTREELDFINAIDPEEDVKFLQKHLKFREICLRNFRLAEILLKRCANNGFTLYQIGMKLTKNYMNLHIMYLLTNSIISLKYNII